MFDATNIIQKLNFDTRFSHFLLKNCTHTNIGHYTITQLQ